MISDNSEAQIHGITSETGASGGLLGTETDGESGTPIEHTGQGTGMQSEREAGQVGAVTLNTDHDRSKDNATSQTVPLDTGHDNDGKKPESTLKRVRKTKKQEIPAPKGIVYAVKCFHL